MMKLVASFLRMPAADKLLRVATCAVSLLVVQQQEQPLLCDEVFQGMQLWKMF